MAWETEPRSVRRKVWAAQLIRILLKSPLLFHRSVVRRHDLNDPYTAYGPCSWDDGGFVRAQPGSEPRPRPIFST
jgi:hypothetical protein